MMCHLVFCSSLRCILFLSFSLVHPSLVHSSLVHSSSISPNSPRNPRSPGDVELSGEVASIIYPDEVEVESSNFLAVSPRRHGVVESSRPFTSPMDYPSTCGTSRTNRLKQVLRDASGFVRKRLQKLRQSIARNGNIVNGNDNNSNLLKRSRNHTGYEYEAMDGLYQNTQTGEFHDTQTGEFYFERASQPPETSGTSASASAISGSTSATTSRSTENVGGSTENAGRNTNTASFTENELLLPIASSSISVHTDCGDRTHLLFHSRSAIKDDSISASSSCIRWVSRYKFGDEDGLMDDRINACIKKSLQDRYTRQPSAASTGDEVGGGEGGKVVCKGGKGDWRFFCVGMEVEEIEGDGMHRDTQFSKKTTVDWNYVKKAGPSLLRAQEVGAMGTQNLGQSWSFEQLIQECCDERKKTILVIAKLA